MDLNSHRLLRLIFPTPESSDPQQFLLQTSRSDSLGEVLQSFETCTILLLIVCDGTKTLLDGLWFQLLTFDPLLRPLHFLQTFRETLTSCFCPLVIGNKSVTL